MSDKSERIMRRLKNCFELVLPQVPRETVETATMDTVEGWDSVATLTLVTALEEEFGLAIGYDRIPDLTSFAAFHEYLMGRIGA